MDDEPTPLSEHPVKSSGIVEFSNMKCMYGVPLKDLPLYPMWITTAGEYNKSGLHSFVPINPGDYISIETTSSLLNFALLKSHNLDIPDYCDGTSQISLSGGEIVDVVAPDDARILFIDRFASSTVDRTQYIKSITINGFDIVNGLYKNFETLNKYIDETDDEFNHINVLLGYKRNIEFSTTGYYISDSGAVVANANFVITPLLEVNEGDVVEYRGYALRTCVGVYDDAGNFLQLVSGSISEPTKVTIPAGYTKLRASAKFQDSNSIIPYFLNIYTNDDYIQELREKVGVLSIGCFDFAGKNVAIIGDSISTNGHYENTNPLGNVPEIIVQPEDIGVELKAYVTYYDIGVTVGGYTITSNDVGNELTFTPVAGDEGKIIGKPKNNNSAATIVWWEVASEVLGFNPIPVCYSGASITSHEYATNTLENSYAWHESQIRKCGIRTPGTIQRTAPDMVIIYRGTNDFSHTPYTYLTDYLETYPQVIPQTDVVNIDGSEKYGFIEGLAITIDKIRSVYPETRIVLCTFNYFHRVVSGQPSRNGINTIYQYNNAIRKVADYFGCYIIEFDKDGITYANAATGEYYNEGTSATANHTHPNTKGHRVMGNRAIIDLMKINA